MNNIKNIATINSMIVSILPSSSEKVTSNGLYVVEEERVQNYGIVEVLPTHVTEEYQDYKKVLSNVKEGDVVFFNPKQTYNVIELKDDPTKKYMIIPLEMIFAYYER